MVTVAALPLEFSLADAVNVAIGALLGTLFGSVVSVWLFKKGSDELKAEARELARLTTIIALYLQNIRAGGNPQLRIDESGRITGLDNSIVLKEKIGIEDRLDSNPGPG